MAITTMDGLVAALETSQRQKLFFPSTTAFSSGWMNLNQAVTSSFGIMAAPAAIGSGGTAFNQSSFSTGFPKWTAGSGTTTYIGAAQSTFTGVGVLHVYDLLYAASGFVGNSATAQTITSPASMPTRNTNGDGAEIWIGCSSAIGATAHNVTVQYTNQAGTSGRNTVSAAGVQSMAANRMYQVALQSGDTGVQSVQGLTLSASSGTAGNLWVMVMRRLCSIGTPIVNVLGVQDFAALGLPKMFDESCLLFNLQAGSGTSGVIVGQLDVIQG